jgi:hypothetical protein
MDLKNTRTTILNQGTAEEKREEIRQYFHATYSLDEQLYETLSHPRNAAEIPAHGGGSHGLGAEVVQIPRSSGQRPFFCVRGTVFAVRPVMPGAGKNGGYAGTNVRTSSAVPASARHATWLPDTRPGSPTSHSGSIRHW